MVLIDELVSPLSKYLDDELPQALEGYDKLWTIEDPEENPYKSKYAARALLEKVMRKVEKLVEKADVEEKERGQEMVARINLYLGKNYFFCEEVPAAERFLNRSLDIYLRSPKRNETEHFIHIQDVFNQLGMLWCQRHGYSEGMNFLRRAQIMFLNRPAKIRETPKDDQKADSNYTLTMFYMAQAYGGLTKPALSARFCAATMSRQLDYNTSDKITAELREKDPFDCKDWVRNCTSLADFFTNAGKFWTAEYLLHSAAAMCEKCQEICGIEPENLTELQAEVHRDMSNMYAARLKFSRGCAENPYLGEEIWKGEHKFGQPKTPEEDAGTKLAIDGLVWDDVFPEIVYLEDEEAQDNLMAEETYLVGEATPPEAPSKACAGEPGARGGWLELTPGEKVQLPVHFKRLHDLATARMRRANKAFLELRGKPVVAERPAPAEEGDEEPAEPVLQEGPSSRRVPSCVGIDFEAAREIFKMSNHYFSNALSYFLLDGWVTDHVKLLQELSQLYRTLLFWETDLKRVAAVVMRRARMLAPLMEQLNPRVYIAFWRQLAFECAEIYQELYELKANKKMPGTYIGLGDDDDDKTPMSTTRMAQCNDLAKKTKHFYDTFIESYHDKGVPDRIDSDNVRVYLTAKLNHARLTTKMRGLSADDQLEQHKLALEEYRFILDYARRNPEVMSNNPETGMAHEIKLCEEMAGMLPSKLSQIAARR